MCKASTIYANDVTTKSGEEGGWDGVARLERAGVHLPLYRLLCRA